MLVHAKTRRSTISDKQTCIAKILSRAPNNKQPCSCQTSLKNLLFHLVQRISLHFKSPDLYLSCTTKVFPKFLPHFNVKEAFKVNNLAPTTMHHGGCHWSRALCQFSGPACSCKKDPCYSRHVYLLTFRFGFVSFLFGFVSFWFRFAKYSLVWSKNKGGGGRGVAGPPPPPRPQDPPLAFLKISQQI